MYKNVEKQTKIELKDLSGIIPENAFSEDDEKQKCLDFINSKANSNRETKRA